MLLDWFVLQPVPVDVENNLHHELLNESDVLFEIVFELCPCLDVRRDTVVLVVEEILPEFRYFVNWVVLPSQTLVDGQQDIHIRHLHQVARYEILTD